MFQVKICGVTTPEDARLAVEAGADAVGLNFYAKSSRYVPPAAARTIAEAIPAGVERVGVFVDTPQAEIVELAAALSLDWIQLHGDQGPEFGAGLPSGIPILRAYRMDESGLGKIAELMQLCVDAGRAPDAVLVDAHVKGQFGGTGKTADWQALQHWQEQPFKHPLVLAGGLTPENVAEAIRTVRPTAVDTASGVESSPGRKDPTKMHAFVEAAKTAFAALHH